MENEIKNDENFVVGTGGGDDGGQRAGFIGDGIETSLVQDGSNESGTGLRFVQYLIRGWWIILLVAVVWSIGRFILEGGRGLVAITAAVVFVVILIPAVIPVIFLSCAMKRTKRKGGRGLFYAGFALGMIFVVVFLAYSLFALIDVRGSWNFWLSVWVAGVVVAFIILICLVKGMCDVYAFYSARREEEADKSRQEIR